MNTQLQEFAFGGKKITTIIYAEKPAFVAVDIAAALGYQNPSKALKDHCESLIKLNYNESLELGFVGKIKGVGLIHEPDVFRLIMHSKLESAERKRQKRLVKQAIKEIADTVQLEFKDF